MKEKIQTQERKIEKYIEENKKFESIIEIHKTDEINEEFEKILREEYNLAKQNEIIFKIEK